MVAFVAGNGLGLSTGSLSILGADSLRGNSYAGRSGEQAYVDVSTGNLVVQRQDEYLAAIGPDLQLLLTYNNQGQMSDDNGDNWRMSVGKTVGTLTGTAN